jgi:NNP family nitrate/nitrite transporter-like MFS transporter
MRGIPLSKEAIAPPKSPSFPVGFLLLLLSTFLINFIGRTLAGPLMPVINQELDVGLGTSGTYFLTLSIGYSVTLFMGQLLSSRLSHKQIIVLSSFGVGVALLSNLVISSGQGLFAFFLLMGVSSGLYFPSGLTVTTAVVAASSWGLGIAVHELAPNLGYLVVPLIGEAVLNLLNWRMGMAIIGGIALIVAVIYHLWGRGSDLYGTKVDIEVVRDLLGKIEIRVSFILFGLAMAVSYGLFVMLPLYLVADRGWDREVANLTLSLSRIPAIAGLLGTGWLVDRIGPAKILWGSLFFSGVASVALSLAPNAWLGVIIPLQALLVVSFFPAGFAFLSRATLLSSRNIGVSLVMAVSTFIGQGIVPTVLGYLGDVGSFSLAIAAVGVVASCGAFLVFLIRRGESQDAGFGP